MQRSSVLIILLLAVLLGAAPPAALGAETGTVTAARAGTPVQFRRGLNVTRLFDTPKRQPGEPAAYDSRPFKPWREQVAEVELDRMRSAGFDFIRLPIDPGPFLAGSGRQQAGMIDQVFDFVAAARKRQLGVVLDMHPRPDNAEWNAAALLQSLEVEKQKRFTALIVALADRLAKLADDRLALELFNEPQRECVRGSGTDWTVFQRKLLRAARGAAPEVNLVVTGPCLSSVDGLVHLDPSDVAGARTYLMVHFYEPHAFTHQGASWSPPARLLAGLGYPIDPGQRDAARDATRRWIDRQKQQGHPADEKQIDFALRTVESYFTRPVTAAAIHARLALAATWADRAGLPRSRVIVGEFGVLRSGGIRLAPGPDRARAAWLRTVASTSEELGFAWAVWGYDGAFGIASEDGARKLEPFTLDALFDRRP